MSTNSLEARGTYALQVRSQTEEAQKHRRAEVIVSVLLLAPAVLGLLITAWPRSSAERG